jgi:pimeloyl-ACP methyl ester carboxylesterase
VRIYLAGHSSGGTLALLAALASGRFRAVAALDATPDLPVFFRPGKAYKEVPFDLGDPRELEVRSPLAYARSLKCPARLYYSEQATPHLEPMTLRFVEVAKGRELGGGAGAWQPHLDGSPGDQAEYRLLPRGRADRAP